MEIVQRPFVHGWSLFMSLGKRGIWLTTWGSFSENDIWWDSFFGVSRETRHSWLEGEHFMEETIARFDPISHSICWWLAVVLSKNGPLDSLESLFTFQGPSTYLLSLKWSAILPRQGRFAFSSLCSGCVGCSKKEEKSVCDWTIYQFIVFLLDFLRQVSCFKPTLTPST